MENNQKTEKISFYTERKSALVQASVIFMLLSAIFRLVDCWGRWNDAFFAATQIALPLACNLLFAAIAGVMVPVMLKRAGYDPALASSIFLTTVTDVMGFFTFLGLATLVLLR